MLLQILGTYFAYLMNTSNPGSQDHPSCQNQVLSVSLQAATVPLQMMRQGTNHLLEVDKARGAKGILSLVATSHHQLTLLSNQVLVDPHNRMYSIRTRMYEASPQL